MVAGFALATLVGLGGGDRVYQVQGLVAQPAQKSLGVLDHLLGEVDRTVWVLFKRGQELTRQLSLFYGGVGGSDRLEWLFVVALGVDMAHVLVHLSLDWLDAERFLNWTELTHWT